MAVKQKYEPISAATAGATHHQSNDLKIVLKPESSDVLEDSTHSARTTRPNPTATRTTGHARRTKRRIAVPVAGAGVSSDALPGPGVGEPLPGQLQRLGHDPGLRHRGHEVGVPRPARSA